MRCGRFIWTPDNLLMWSSGGSVRPSADPTEMEENLDHQHVLILSVFRHL